jgi:DNA-directed RNA polymerase subunit H (RpoH/RPB5)
LAAHQAGIGLHRPPVVPKPRPLPDGSYSDDEIRALAAAATEIVRISNPLSGSYHAALVDALKQLASEAPHLLPQAQPQIRVSDPIIVQARERELAEAAAVAETEAAPKKKTKVG